MRCPLQQAVQPLLWDFGHLFLRLPETIRYSSHRFNSTIPSTGFVDLLAALPKFLNQYNFLMDKSRLPEILNCVGSEINQLPSFLVSEWANHNTHKCPRLHYLCMGHGTGKHGVVELFVSCHVAHVIGIIAVLFQVPVRRAGWFPVKLTKLFPKETPVSKYIPCGPSLRTLRQARFSSVPPV